MKLVTRAGGAAWRCVLALVLHAVYVLPGHAVDRYSEEREPCGDHAPLKQPFFGDLHVHTRFSLDASTQGTRTTPAQAYRFARGEPLGIQPFDQRGKAMRSIALERPLDFAMVADHAELLGEVHMCNTPGYAGYDSWECGVFRRWPTAAYYLFNAMSSMFSSHLGLCGSDDAVCKTAARIPWNDTLRAAETYYDRSADCRFTTFVGYEWTGMEPVSGGNLHRNVVFRNANVPSLPITFIDQNSAEELWRALDTQCNDVVGTCEALAIPHNSNLSAGYMFDGKRDDGSPMTAEYARLRQRHEPLMEVMQKGGSSECFFQAGVTRDELCAFEQQSIDNLAGYGTTPDPNTGFARRVLLHGMALDEVLGTNPYRLGFIGSTDTHLGAAGAVSEGGYVGHGGKGVPALEAVPPGLPDLLETSPGALAVLWAEENSRDSLFDALRRREVYATSGPRITSRFFGGWHYPADICDSSDRLELAYSGGVPMGGDLPGHPGGKPAFLVIAAQDPGTGKNPGVPLQRVQLVKGWLDDSGEWQEAVMDVAGDTDSGAAVDTSTCERRGSGARAFCVLWKDDDFQPGQRAYYYTRVLENPTCRWSQRICVERGVDCSVPGSVGEGLQACCDPGHRKVIQERALSSPIWYRAEAMEEGASGTPVTVPPAASPPPG